MRRVAIRAEEIGAIRTTRHGALFGLAGGTQYCHVLDSGHVQYIGENVVARERPGALRTNGSLLTAFGTADDRTHLGVPGLVHEKLVETGFAEHVETGEHPGRAQLALAYKTGLIVGLAVAAGFFQGVPGIPAVVADRVALLAEYIAAVELLGAASPADVDAAVRRRRRRHRRGPGRNNGHRGRCHPAIPRLRMREGGGEGRAMSPDDCPPTAASPYPGRSRIRIVPQRVCCMLFFFFLTSLPFFSSLLFVASARGFAENERAKADRDGEDILSLGSSSSHEARDPRNIVLSRSLARDSRECVDRSSSPPPPSSLLLVVVVVVYVVAL